MALKLGNSTVGSLYLGSDKVSEAYLGSTKVYNAGAPALAPKSLRFEFYDDFDPTQLLPTQGLLNVSWKHVGGAVYDFHCDDSEWYFSYGTTYSIWDIYYYSWESTLDAKYPMRMHELEVLDGDLAGVTKAMKLFSGLKRVHRYSIRNTVSLTDVSNMFYLGTNGLTYLEEISLFDTSSVTNFEGMFRNTVKSTNEMSIPLFDTSSAVNVQNMFNGSTKITGGALALYTQMSTQANPPTTYTNCFTNCGSQTVSGAQELAQIPTSWGGTMA